MADITKVKGFRDIFAPQSVRREQIRRLIEDAAKKYAFMPIETPTIEYESLIRGNNESDEAVSDRFKLTDKGARELGLRFEFTFQLSRILQEFPHIKLPWRRYQVGNVFRDEPLRPDRFREFIQFDADIVGDPSITADAECLALAQEVLTKLNISGTIKVNNRKLLNAILMRTEVVEHQQQVLREIDKLDKLTEKEVRENLKKLIPTKKITALFELFSHDLRYFVDEHFEGANEIAELEKLGKLYGFEISFTPTLMRGFSYYTGNVWEVWSTEKRAALAGGGRYDDKVGIYAGKQIPAVGISFGTLIDFDGKDITHLQTQFLVVSLGADSESIALTQKIRAHDASALVFFGKPTKALEYANAYYIKNVIFIGEKELKEKKFSIKNLTTGKELKLSEKDLLKKISQQAF